MSRKHTLEREMAEIASQELELLVKYTAEWTNKSANCSRRFSLADKIAHAIMQITDVYKETIKKNRGGWTCGTHMNHVRTALSRKIASQYSDEQLSRFAEVCVTCIDSQKPFLDADQSIKDMAADFLSMRPAPLVHPAASLFRQELETAEQTEFDQGSGAESTLPSEPGREQVYAEVYQVILHMEKGLQIMIPRKFIQFLRKNMDTQWGHRLDFTQNCNDMDLLQETRALLMLVYRDFICSPDERMELIKKANERPYQAIGSTNFSR